MVSINDIRGIRRVRRGRLKVSRVLPQDKSRERTRHIAIDTRDRYNVRRVMFPAPDGNFQAPWILAKRFSCPSWILDPLYAVKRRSYEPAFMAL